MLCSSKSFAANQHWISRLAFLAIHPVINPAFPPRGTTFIPRVTFIR
jgi:hypothetical protein